MAGLRSSIQLIDGASAVLDRITGKNDRMMNSINNAQNAMNRKTAYVDNLSNAGQKLELLAAQYANQTRIVDRLSREYQKAAINKGRDAEQTEKLKSKLMSAQMKELQFAEAVEKAGRALEDQDSGMRNSIRSSDNLANKLMRLVGVYLGIRGLKKGVQATLGEAAKLTEQAAIMQAAFGDVDIGKAYFNKLQAYAIKARQPMEDLTNITRNFMQLTRNTSKLMKLTDIANKLSRRTQGLGSAENLIQEAIGGRFTRLQRTLHLTDSQIEPLKQAVQKGSLDGIINAFGVALNIAGLTDDIVKAFEESPLQRLGRITDTFKLKLAATGQAALELLGPVMNRIDAWLQSDNASQFFAKIADGITGVVEKATALYSFISGNWGYIEPAIWGIITAMTAWVLVTKLAAIQQMILNSVMLANPWTWIIMAIIAVSVALYKLWKTNDDFAAGVMRVWNSILNFFDRVPIFFAKVGYGIADAFDNARIKVLEIVQGMINGVISAINWLLDKLYAIQGISREAIEKVDFTTRAVIEAEANKQAREKNIANAEMIAASMAAAREANVQKMIAEREAKRLEKDKTVDAIDRFAAQEAAWNAEQLDTLGSIEKSVDKSDEDLKWLRDIAEQETINRFTAATLAPQLSFAFGDVRETADVDGIIDRLRDVLNEQLVIAAEGVHE